MYDPNNPVSGGGFNMTGGDPNQVMQALSGQPMSYQQMKHDWKMQRPEFGAFNGDRNAYHAARMDWRSMKPDRHALMNALNGNSGMQGLPTPQPQAPVIPPINGQLPMNPYGSYGG